MVKDEDKQLLVDSFKAADKGHGLGAFLDDLLTEQEMADLAQRVRIAKGIIKDKTYLEVSDKVKASTTTITKVGQIIKYGRGAFKKLFGKKGG
ncbi:hypothetical protein HY440_00880 [Candidatus Microgenomates bacterium]|nr:hypothetical protein [Candidatus Microgenomates bacterium]